MIYESAGARLIKAFKPVDGSPVSLEGRVEDVRLVNQSNGWGFGSLYISSARVIVPFTGGVEDLYVGADVALRGKWTKHRKYGWQLKTAAVDVREPMDASGAFGWLSHRLPHVGHVRARSIVQMFPPPRLWEVLDSAPQELANVSGITPGRAEEIAQAYQDWKYERVQFVELAELGLKPSQIREAVRAWRNEAADRIRANPYILRLLPGFSFKAVDAIARKMGVTRSDPRRLRAGIAYAAVLSEREGHTCRGENKLISLAASDAVLGVRMQRVAECWQAVLDAGDLCKGPGGFYRPEMLEAERTIAKSVGRLLRYSVGTTSMGPKPLVYRDESMEF